MRLVFVGSGRFAMELFGWMRQTGALKGYSDLAYISPSKSEIPMNYLGEIDPKNTKLDDHLVLAIGDSKYRKEAIEKLKSIESSFISYIHPTSLINDNVILGKGAVVFPFCIISNDTQIGNFLFMNGYSSIGHDCKIGDNLVMSPYAAITGNCRLGNNIYMATHSTLIPGRSVGDAAKFSAGSVATKNVPEGYTVMGNMGQMIKL